MDLDLLENTGMMKTFIFLYRNKEGVMKIDLRKKLGLAAATAQNIHSILFEKQLIENVPDKDRLLFALSDKGKKIAERLMEIENILKDRN